MLVQVVVLILVDQVDNLKHLHSKTFGGLGSVVGILGVASGVIWYIYGGVIIIGGDIIGVFGVDV